MQPTSWCALPEGSDSPCLHFGVLRLVCLLPWFSLVGSSFCVRPLFVDGEPLRLGHGFRPPGLSQSSLRHVAATHVAHATGVGVRPLLSTLRLSQRRIRLEPAATAPQPPVVSATAGTACTAAPVHMFISAPSSSSSAAASARPSAQRSSRAEQRIRARGSGEPQPEPLPGSRGADRPVPSSTPSGARSASPTRLSIVSSFPTTSMLLPGVTCARRCVNPTCRNLCGRTDNPRKRRPHRGHGVFCVFLRTLRTNCLGSNSGCLHFCLH